jgi:hypothetical protein
MRNLLITGAAALMISACALPFGLGRPSASQLESGAADYLAKAKSFEANAAFLDGPKAYKLDIEFAAPSTVHIGGTQGDNDLEMLSYNGKAYYKGQLFLNTLLVDPNAQKLLKGARDRWVTSSQIAPIDTSAITDPSKTKLLLSGAGSNRQDDVTFNGQNTAELTLPAVIVNITEDSPYRLVRLRSIAGQALGGTSHLDVAFTNYNKDFGIQAPSDAFDFDDPTTWPPRYQIDAVHQQEASQGSCGDPCVLSADMENTGGMNGGPAPSTVTFVLTANDQSSLGSCKATIQPDRTHGQKFSVTCSIQTSAWTNYAGNYTYGATVDNPAYD